MFDTQGKPTYPAEQCPTCPKWQAERIAAGKPICNECGAEIPKYENMTDGYRSQTVDHWHFEALGSVIGTSVIFRTLCLECYRTDWAVKYPDEACPV